MTEACLPGDRVPTPDQVRIVQVSNAMLRELLKFPPGTKIIGYNLARSWECHLPDLELKVLHPDFDAVQPGTRISYATPSYSQHLGTMQFVSW